MTDRMTMPGNKPLGDLDTLPGARQALVVAVKPPFRPRSHLVAVVARIAVAAFALVTLLESKLHELETFNGLPLNDAGVFASIGMAVSRGAVPYRDLWDHKPPAIYYIDALLFRVFAARPWDTHLIEMAIAGMGSLAFYALCRSFTGPLISAGGAAVYTFFSTTPALDEGGNLTQTYWMPTVTLAMAIVFLTLPVNDRTRSSIESEPTAPRSTSLPWVWPALAVAGVLFATACLLMPQSCLDLGVAACAILLTVQSTRMRLLELTGRIAALLIPVLVICGVLLLYFRARGAGAALWSDVVVYNTFYARAVGASDALRLLLQVRVGLFLWGLAGVAALVVLIRPRGDIFHSAQDFFRPVVLLWFLVGLIETSADRHFWPHDFLLSVPSACALLTYTVHDVLVSRGAVRQMEAGDMRLAASRMLGPGFLVLAGICLTVIARDDVLNAGVVNEIGITRAGSGDSGVTLPSLLDTHPSRLSLGVIGPYALSMPVAAPSDDQRVAAEVDRLSRPGDTMYVWGLPTGAYAIAQRRPASRYLYFLPLVDSYGGFSGGRYATGAMRARLISDLRANRPRVVVVERDVAYHLARLPALRHFLAVRYTRVTLSARSRLSGFVFYLERPGMPRRGAMR
jgi:hypothetical protein